MGQVLELLKVPPTVSASYGVYCDANLDYYIVKVSLASVSAGKVVFTTDGNLAHTRYKEAYTSRTVRASLPGDNSEQIKHEAYILGQIDSHEALVDIGTFSSVIGSPFYYGWNFNWDCSEALCVTHQAVWSGEQVAYYNSRKYQMFITETVGGDGTITLSAAVATPSAAVWYPFINHPLVWTPNLLEGNMSLVAFPGCPSANDIVDGYKEHSFDVPIYGFYDVNGNEELIYYKQAMRDGKTLSELQQESLEATCHCYGHEFSGPGYLDVEYEGFGSSADVEVYSSSGLRYEGVWGTDGLFVRIECSVSEGSMNCDPSRDYYVSSLDVFTRTTGIFYPAGQRVYAGWKISAADYKKTTDVSPGTYSADTKIGIIIPFHSSETCYMGSYRSKYDGVSTVHRWYDQVASEVAQWTDRIAYGGVRETDWIGIWFPSYPACTGDYVASCKKELTHTYNVAGPCAPTLYVDDEGHDREWEVKFGVVTAFESTTLEDITTEDWDSLDGYLHILNPALCSSDLVPVQYVKNYQSAFGNSIKMISAIRPDEVADPFYPIGSNCSITPEQAEPYALWLGRS